MCAIASIKIFILSIFLRDLVLIRGTRNRLFLLFALILLLFLQSEISSDQVNNENVVSPFDWNRFISWKDHILAESLIKFSGFLFDQRHHWDSKTHLRWCTSAKFTSSGNKEKSLAGRHKGYSVISIPGFRWTSSLFGEPSAVPVPDSQGSTGIPARIFCQPLPVIKLKTLSVTHSTPFLTSSLQFPSYIIRNPDAMDDFKHKV